MTIRSLLILISLATFFAPSVVWAKPNIAGSYSVTFEEVSNNCKDTGMSFSKANVSIKQNEKKISVKVPMVPIMTGKVTKGGKLRAKAKKGPVSIRGLEGSFGVAGSVTNKAVQFIFIANFYQGDKPICTQSWSVTGKKG